jgi:hypothetical protein
VLPSPREAGRRGDTAPVMKDAGNTIERCSRPRFVVGATELLHHVLCGRLTLLHWLAFQERECINAR